MPERSEHLAVSGRRVLEGLADGVQLRTVGEGAVVSYTQAAASSRATVCLGIPVGIVRYVVLFRGDPFWLVPRAGREIAQIPVGTEFLLAELEGGEVLLIAPLVQAPFVVTLEGRGSELFAIADTGTAAVAGSEITLAYVAVGTDVFALVQTVARAVAEELRTALRREHAPPDFVDGLGWCTWDAFYHEVSHANLRAGLASFREGGVTPGFVVIDDGWQSIASTETGEKRLASLDANQRFPGGIAASVKLAKQEFGVRWVLVWHAVHGYWGGLHPERFTEYAVTLTQRSYPSEIRAHRPDADAEWFGHSVGVPSAHGLTAFYDDLHAGLASAGVDGVKVDNQASIESLGAALGGRVEAACHTHSTLNDSIERHFGGRGIACMACASSLLYQAGPRLTRTSNDFWPDRPESHGEHAYTNMLVSLWFGEFIWPDWDMFQSGHEAGAYHAALRVLSGGPIYVSDKPGIHDFALLNRLTLSDGSVLRADDVGRPTRDCLFEAVTRDPVLLKLWNRNGKAGVIGLFHACSADEAIAGSFAAADIPTLVGDDFVLFFHRGKRVVRSRREQRHALKLLRLGWEVVAVVPVERGVAVLGLADKLNAGATFTAGAWQGDRYCLKLRDGGEFMAWCETEPRAVWVDGALARDVSYADQVLRVQLARGARYALEIHL